MDGYRQVGSGGGGQGDLSARGVSVALPILQSERPQHQTEHDEYLGTVLQTLESVGLGAFIRGENTADMVELQPKDLDTVRPSYFQPDGATPRDGYSLSEAMRQEERRQEFRYEEQAKAAKLTRITADKSALLARMVTVAVGKHAGLLARLRSGNEMKHEQTKADGTKETVSSKYLFDGVGMMNDFLAYLKRAVRADEVDFHMDTIAAMRQHPSPPRHGYAGAAHRTYGPCTLTTCSSPLILSSGPMRTLPRSTRSSR